MHEILAGSTDSLHFDVPAAFVGAGVVSTAQVRVMSPSTPLPDAWTTATAEAVAWTLAAAPRGASTIARTANTGADEPRSQRSYVLLGAGEDSAQPTVVEAAGVSADGVTMTLREPLPVAVAAGMKMLSRRYSVALTAGQTESPGYGVAVWKFTTAAPVEGRTEHVFEVGFRIAKRLAFYGLTPATLTRLFPILHRKKSPTDPKLDEAIEAAWNIYVRPDLEARQIDLSRVKSWEPIDTLLASATVHHVLSLQEDVDADYREEKRNAYEDRREVMLSRREFWYDSADNRSQPSADPVHGKYGGSARMVR